MQLYNNFNNISKLKKLIFLALLVSMALVLSYIEKSIPLPFVFPGVKLGLANAITLTALYFFGFRDTFMLVVIRVIMNSIFVGNMMSIWYSLTGGLLSFFVMYILIRFFGQHISAVGISIAGAFFHNVGQLIVVAFVTKSVLIAISYLPILSIAGVISGLLIGIFVKLCIPYLRRNIFSK